MDRKEWPFDMIRLKAPVLLRDILLTVVGTVIYALGVYIFTAPNQIAPGGVSGLATVINFLTGAPIGLVTAAINLPLLILGWIYLGKTFILKTMISVLNFALIYDHVYCYLPSYSGSTLLAAVFGGVLIGVGVGITFYCEGSTGGLDIANLLVKKKYPRFKISTLVLASDIVVIILAMIAYRNFDSAMYAMISMYVQSKLIVLVLCGTENGKMVMLVTRFGKEVSDFVMHELERGVTKIPSIGAYSNTENETLLCAVRQNEYHRLKRVVHKIDPDAFVIVVSATEVVGYGFQSGG